MSSRTHVLSCSALAVIIAGAAACSTDSLPTAEVPVGAPVENVAGVPHDQASQALDAVLAGNAQSIVAAPGLVPPGAPLAPFIEARLYAISNVAIHDALNAIVPRFERYADTGPIVRNAAIAPAVL